MSDRTGLITVIIPVYNVEEYLSRCIDSVINNTYSKLQIICIDDGSRDNSGSILDYYENMDSRIHVIHQRNKGVSAARNAGLRESKGEYIAFIDADDWVHPQYFEVMITLAQRLSASIVISSFIKTGEDIGFSKLDNGIISEQLVTFEHYLTSRKMKNYVWGKLYKTDLLKDVFFCENITLGEDAVFNAAIIYRLTRHSKIYYIDKELYFYYDRPGSILHTESSEALIIVSELLWDYSTQSNDLQLKSLYIQEAMKKTLTSRYSAIQKSRDKEFIARCNSLLEKCCDEVFSSKLLSLSDRIIYLIMYKKPLFYRLFKIINDPSILKWEKTQRKRN